MTKKNKMAEKIINFIPNFDRKVWWLLGGYTVSLFGSGLTMPFLIIYLHSIRHINLSFAGVILAAISFAGIFAVPIGGGLFDRLGAAKSLIITLIVSAIGQAGFAFIQGPIGAIIVAMISGAGSAAMWNSLSSMLAENSKGRSEVFAVAFGFQNLGSGLGAALGGWFINVNSPKTFEVIFLADAFTFLIFAVLIMLLRDAWDTSQIRKNQHIKTHGKQKKGYRFVIKDRTLIGIASIYALLAFVLVGLQNAAFPVWATEKAHSTTDVVGLAFMANSIIIVVGQLVVLKMVKGKSRMKATSITALLYGGASIFTLLAAKVTGIYTTSILILALSVCAIGEIILSPCLPALVNDLAPGELRGRYNAIFNLSWQVGMMVGPPVASSLLNQGFGEVLFLGFGLISILIALFAIRLERMVPAWANKGISESTLAR